MTTQEKSKLIDSLARILEVLSKVPKHDMTDVQKELEREATIKLTKILETI